MASSTRKSKYRIRMLTSIQRPALQSLLAASALLPCLSEPLSAQLGPGQILRLEFPDLPDTLAGMHKGERQVPQLVAVLPEDYAADREFPLFVFLGGGDGGPGDNAGAARRIVGETGYVAANLPLFKRGIDPEEPVRGLMVSMDDFDIIQAAYHTILGKLFEAVPNLRKEGSAIGGFSNGAHTAGVLLAGQDPFLLEAFDHYYFIEGGVGPLLANALHKSAFRSKRLLVLYGDRPAREGGPPYFAAKAEALGELGNRYGLDLKIVPMPGFGHEQPPEYLRFVGKWVRESTTGAGETGSDGEAP